MTAPWWGREASPNAIPIMVTSAGPARKKPQLHPQQRGLLKQDLLQRVAAYTPEWTNQTDSDAGFALLQLFDEMTLPILERLNRLPEKAFIEFLNSAGVSALPPQPSRTLLSFTASDSAPGSILLAEGFQASAPAADGSGDSIVFETERSIYVAPGTLDAAFRDVDGQFEELDIDPESSSEKGFLPFGSRPAIRDALLLGFNAQVAPQEGIAIAFVLSAEDGAPAPIARGGSEVQAPPVSALLRWEAFDDGSFASVAIIRDDTRALTQSGVIEIRVPARWRRGTPRGVDRDEDLFWLRLRFAHGSFDTVPRIRAVYPNSVMASAVRTIRDEVVEFVPGTDRRELQLAQTPVLAGSLVLTVDEGGAEGTNVSVWEETENLAVHGGEDKRYELNAANGIVRTGDAINGARLPRGFRNVVASSYQVGGGAAGRVEAESVTRLVNSVPFLTGVNNPLPASGGNDEEPRIQTLKRGPQQIRARGRAVTTADYALLALQAPGADVQRAHSRATHDPRFPGAILPGSVSVLLVSSDRGADLPLADSGTLESVATYLTDEVAPAGVQVVTSTPRFHRISVRASVVIDDGADVGVTVDHSLQAFQDYLHPLIGGDGRDGWPFGGIVRHQALVRMLLAEVSGAITVPTMNLIVDGVLLGSCEDFTPTRDALFWPSSHEVIPVPEVENR